MDVDPRTITRDRAMARQRPTGRSTHAAVVVALLMCVVIPSARANSAFAPSAVHLTAAGADDELGKMTDDAEFAVMEFYASWCPHCQNFGPKWEAVAAFFNKGVGHDPSGTRPDPRVTVFSVDCVTEGDMCQAFTVRGYPTVLFGTLAQFKREHAKKGSGALDKIAVGSPETVIRQIGTKTGGLYVLSPAVAADAASRSRPTVDPDAAGAVDDPALPHADLADVVHATVQAYREMTSPALLTPESRDAFANFLHLLAETHPVRACKDGASDVADSLDVDWPVDGLVDLGETRATLASKHICGEAHAARPNAEEWRACAGSTPGKRGYTCGLWLLFHSSAARSSATARDAGATWFAAVVGWIEHFFPCDDCRSHFLDMAKEAGDSVRTKRDAVLFAWRAHNRVNARLAAAEARGDDVGSGDPSYPKVQWPTAEQCEACRAPVVGLKRGDEPRWNEEETYKFLAAYFHGIGAPRLTVTNPNPKAEAVAVLGASDGVGEGVGGGPSLGAGGVPALGMVAVAAALAARSGGMTTESLGRRARGATRGLGLGRGKTVTLMGVGATAARAARAVT